MFKFNKQFVMLYTNYAYKLLYYYDNVKLARLSVYLGYEN